MHGEERLEPRTRRQSLMDLLNERELSFEELRGELAASVRLLEDDLKHVDRSLRHGDRRLAVKPAQCAACGYEFRGRAPRHFHTPSRCPRCRSEHVLDARFRVVDR
jgi:predicted Zn-ribbon and HTH transcriptional regulator